MASIDKAAIVFSIAITLVGVGIAAMGGSMDNSPAAPTQQMSSATNTDAAEKAEAAAAKAAAAEAAAAKAAERAAAADAAAAEKAEAAAAKAAAKAAAEKAAAADAAEAKAMAEAEAKAMAEAKAAAAEAAAAAAGPETHIVETAIGSGAPGCETSNACYLPQDITINAGDTVTWDNVDNAAHTVTGGSPANGPSGVFDSSLLMAKGVFSHTFDDAGYYDYFCMVHPWMIGSVTVN
ncbi:plastocyanin [Candidatus Nitrosomarinus catalina]|uniref:Plastocyanin n=1 Tax=Candidatus Nitrosomarinus catalinensis TaxID=1898749 RepID=A0A2Z2HMW8_9ARCH|nr:plastocyanin/azurin family copper-binding protein [Candidatus Nitrosomarinus catalina]ARS64146.1 plastocyanin [Candidatus Nitrosomarinus catalina]